MIAAFEASDVACRHSIGEHIVERYAQLVLGVEPSSVTSPGVRHMHIFERDVAINRQQVAGEGRVMRREQNGIPDVANADVFIDNVVDKAASAGVALDADSVVGAVNRQIEDAHRVYSPAGFAADRHAVPGVEMIVRDGDVRWRAPIFRL